MKEEKPERIPFGCLFIYIVVFLIAGLVVVVIGFLIAYFKFMGGWDNPGLVISYIFMGTFVVFIGVMFAALGLEGLKNKKK